MTKSYKELAKSRPWESKKQSQVVPRAGCLAIVSEDERQKVHDLSAGTGKLTFISLNSQSFRIPAEAKGCAVLEILTKTDPTLTEKSQ